MVSVQGRNSDFSSSVSQVRCLGFSGSQRRMEWQSASSAGAPDSRVWFPFRRLLASGDVSSWFVLICVPFCGEMEELSAVPPSSSFPFRLVGSFLGHIHRLEPYDELLPAEWQKSRTSPTGPGRWEG